jgi:hypothetical protein
VGKVETRSACFAERTVRTVLQSLPTLQWPPFWSPLKAEIPYLFLASVSSSHMGTVWSQCQGRSVVGLGIMQFPETPISNSYVLTMANSPSCCTSGNNIYMPVGGLVFDVVLSERIGR